MNNSERAKVKELGRNCRLLCSDDHTRCKMTLLSDDLQKFFGESGSRIRSGHELVEERRNDVSAISPKMITSTFCQEVTW